MGSVVLVLQQASIQESRSLMSGSHHRCTNSDEIYTAVALSNEIFSFVNFVLQVCRLRCNAQEFELNSSRGMCMIQSMNAYYHIQLTRQTCRFAFVVNQGISQRKFDKACSLDGHIIFYFYFLKMAFNFEYADLPLILVFSCCIVTVNFGKNFFGSFFTLGNALGRGYTRMRVLRSAIW